MKTEQELSEVVARLDADYWTAIEYNQPCAMPLVEDIATVIDALPALLSRTEQAEARVKELEEEIERRAAQEEMDDALRDGCMDSLLAAESSLKERDELLLEAARRLCLTDDGSDEDFAGEIRSALPQVKEQGR